MAWRIVRPTYIPQSFLAVLSRVVPRFDTDGPVNSALANAMPPPSALEKIRSPSIMTPIPPIHWETDLQRMRLFLWLPRQSPLNSFSPTKPEPHTGLVAGSTSEAPVVVNPDIDSNQEWSRPYNT